MVEASSQRIEQIRVQTENLREVEEKPVLKSVLLEEQVDIQEKKLITENVKQDVVEIHEQPIVRKVQHQPFETRVEEQAQQVIIGEQEAELEKEISLLEIQQPSDIAVTELRKERILDQKEEIVSIQKNVNHEIHNRQVITEIHQQPIVEIHEQPVNVTIYERPIIKKVEHEVIYETVQAPPLIESREFSGNAWQTKKIEKSEKKEEKLFSQKLELTEKSSDQKMESFESEQKKEYQERLDKQETHGLLQDTLETAKDLVMGAFSSFTGHKEQ
jgi:hypothetical protein